MNRKGKLFFLVVIVLAIIISGCNPTPGPQYNPIQALGDGHDVNVSRFNGKCIYTMITVQPENKPEDNDAPSTVYPFLLTTTASSSPSKTFTQSENNLSEGGIYSKNQTSHDLIMRQAENEALASRESQFRLKESQPPASILVGTKWDDVNVLAGTWKLIDTTCQYISDHAYFFVDNRNVTAMETYLAGYGTAFDAIYDVNHSKFGTENDTDSNGKVIIVFSKELSDGLLGYFYAIDKYSKATYTHSNEGDIFYITTTPLSQGNRIKGTLAHEFQHMIYFDQHYNRDVTMTQTWLNEALSQAAEFYNNYLVNHLGWIRYYLEDHWVGLSLTHWTSNNYGYGAIFIRYLIDQYGNQAIKKMCATEKIGVAAVEDATGADFNTIFNNFTRALVLSGTGDTNNSRYNFRTLDLQSVQPNGRGGLVTTSEYDAGNVITMNLYPYRISFDQWNGAFGVMNLSGTSVVGTAFGCSQ